MRRLAPVGLVASAVLSCSTSPTGTLEIGPVEEGRAFAVTFVPSGSPPSPGEVYLEFQTVDATLVLEGSVAANHGCLPLPSTLKLVVLTGSDGLLPGARIRVSAWSYEPPEVPKGTTATTMTPEVPIAMRCSGTLIADATYSVPVDPDAGFVADASNNGTSDAGFVDTGVAPDRGTSVDSHVEDANATEGGEDDASDSDAGLGLDADLADTSTTTSTVTDAG